MKLIYMNKIKDGKYIKNYELIYLNKAGKEKRYEMVSRNDLQNQRELGRYSNGISIVAFQNGKLLLLREFRMSVNRSIYNLCAGMLEKDESVEDCVKRELFEETGLSVKKIYKILPPSFSAVGISDMKTSIVFVEAEGEFSDHTSDNELIQPMFYSKEEVRALLEEKEFSSRAQSIAYFFANGFDFFD